MAVTVKKERGKGGKAFWGLPGLLGQEPGLWLEKKEDALSGSTHHASCFLAWEDGQPAARIFVDKSAELSRKRGESCALFGLLMGKKQEAVQAVLEAAEREARRLGAARLLGPLHPRDWEQGRGLLLGGECFGRRDPDWMRECLEKKGYREWKAWDVLTIKAEQIPVLRLEKAAAWAKQRHGYVAVSMGPENTRRMAGDVAAILRAAGEYPQNGFGKMAREMGYRLEPAVAYIVYDRAGRPAACLAGMPDYDWIARQMQGRWGLRHAGEFQRLCAKAPGCRFFLQAAVPAAQGKGAILAAYAAALEGVEKRGYSYIQAGLMGEVAWLSRHTCRALGGTPACRAAVFEKNL